MNWIECKTQDEVDAAAKRGDGAIVRDSANVRAYGSANVTAYGSANVRAYGSANVTAYDSANVTAYGSANVRAYDSANVTAYGSANGMTGPHGFDSDIPQGHDAGHEGLAAVGVNALTLPVNVPVLKVAQVRCTHPAVEHEQDLSVEVRVGPGGVYDLTNLVGLPVGHPHFLPLGLAGSALFLVPRRVEGVGVERRGDEPADARGPIEKRPHQYDVLFASEHPSLQGSIAQGAEQLFGGGDFAEVAHAAVAADTLDHVVNLASVAGALAGSDPTGVQIGIELTQEQVDGLADQQIVHPLFGLCPALPALAFGNERFDGDTGRNLAEIGAVRLAGKLLTPAPARVPGDAVVGLEAGDVGGGGLVASVTRGVTRGHNGGIVRVSPYLSRRGKIDKPSRAKTDSASGGRGASEGKPRICCGLDHSGKNGTIHQTQANHTNGYRTQCYLPGYSAGKTRPRFGRGGAA